MLAAMDDELLEGAACAGSDLTARLLAELARATDCLAVAQARVHAAAALGTKPPERLRAEARACQRQVGVLRQVLSGMPDFGGGGHAAIA